MDKTQSTYFRTVTYAASLALVVWIIWAAYVVFLLAFAGILLAIFLHAIGSGAKKVTHLSYPLALLLGMLFILGILTLIFWLYSPIITEQFYQLIKQLPAAAESLRANINQFFGVDIFSQQRLQNLFSTSNQKLVSQVLAAFSTTIGSLVGFFVFLIVGLYLAVNPKQYLNWLIHLVPPKKRNSFEKIVYSIGQSLHWWILGKLLSMLVVGIATFVGLSLLGVNLALILGFLAGLLTFIPYVGAILAAIPAVLIGFAQSPLKALYVTLLYIGIHAIEGYFITPNIEQRTVSIPPALSILAQMLLALMVGGLGLALATPLTVVALAIVNHFNQRHLK